MPHKLAIVVEGHTEMIFAEALVKAVAKQGSVRVERRRASGGAKMQRQVVEIEAEADTGQPFYVLIYCSATDSRVATDILENYRGWCKAGYAGIVGLRDVFPSPRSDIENIRRLMSYTQKTKPLKVQNCLAVMEVEAWFLGEHTHFERIDGALTLQAVVAQLSFDPSSDDVEARTHPSDDLHGVYQTVGKAYRKRIKQIERTVNALSMEQIYLDVMNRVPSLKELIDCLEAFFAGSSWNADVAPLPQQAG